MGMGQVIPYNKFLQLRATRLSTPRAGYCFFHRDLSRSVTMRSREDTNGVPDRVAQVKPMRRGNLYVRAVVGRP
jgi:hypothetical protein